jgi:virulence-associated protein VapD
MTFHPQLETKALAALFGVGETLDSPESPWRKGRMYAISFDLDTNALKRHHPSAHPNYGYEEIARELKKHGFTWQQGSLYFGNDSVTPVTCTLAVQALKKACPWFPRAVRDIRMMRIEESSDLTVALGEPDLFDAPAPASANND